MRLWILFGRGLGLLGHLARRVLGLPTCHA